MKTTISLTFALLFFFNPFVFALEKGVLEIAEDHKIYYQVTKAIGEQKGSLLVFNGLIYNMNYWNSYRKGMSQAGYQVIQIAYSPHPESLRELGSEDEIYYLKWKFNPFVGLWQQSGTSLDILAIEANEVLKHLEIEGAVDIVSLSYGSLPATNFAKKFPERVGHFLLFAPAVQSSHFYESVLQLTGWDQAFRMSEGIPLADYNYSSWLRSTLYFRMSRNSTEQDNYVPYGLEFNLFFESVFHLANAVRYADLKENIEGLPSPSEMTLVLAERENPSLYEDQLKTWEKIKDLSLARKQLVKTKGTYHAIPGAHPKTAVMITKKALSHQFSETEAIIEAID